MPIANGDAPPAMFAIANMMVEQSPSVHIVLEIVPSCVSVALHRRGSRDKRRGFPPFSEDGLLIGWGSCLPDHHKLYFGRGPSW